MKAKLSGLTLALAVAGGVAGPAFAGGDVIYTGVGDPAVAVPVPAPIPVTLYEPEYYVRFDTGAAWLSDGTLDESGSGMTVRDIGDVEALEYGSIGAGRYLTPSIRAELQVDLFTRGEIADGAETFNEVFFVTQPDTSVDTVTYDVTRQEKIKYEQDVAMLNFYYDFINSTRFTPYVGAGIGVTYRQLSRESSEDAVCSSLSNTADPTRNCSDAVPPSASEPETSVTRNRWDIAASAMAGLAIELTDDVIWDTSYRYLWQNGSLSVSAPTLAGTSRVEIKDIGQHELRTGIRLNLN